MNWLSILLIGGFFIALYEYLLVPAYNWFMDWLSNRKSSYAEVVVIIVLFFVGFILPIIASLTGVIPPLRF